MLTVRAATVCKGKPASQRLQKRTSSWRWQAVAAAWTAALRRLHVPLPPQARPRARPPAALRTVYNLSGDEVRYAKEDSA